VVRMLGHNRRPFALAAGQESFEISHHVPALSLGGLMAPLAISLQDRPHVAVVADLGALRRRIGRARFTGESVKSQAR